ncbi:MAG: gamma-glutamyl-gamma-aminobutyrate hydrolase family protein [Cyanobacteria bacterium P01_H01_bin.15]
MPLCKPPKSSPTKILTVIHQETTSVGAVGRYLIQQGYELEKCLPCAGQPLPTSLSSYAGVIIFGGPMSANDDQTLGFIRQELLWLPKALESNCPILGICLGAQLIARTLGATVRRHPTGYQEIGYFPISSTIAGRSQFANLHWVYQWHQEGFELPAGAIRLATGDSFPEQAFRYGERVYGVQFHPEMVRPLLKVWLKRGATLLNVPGAQSIEEQLQQEQLVGQQTQQWLQTFMPQWLGTTPT